MRWCVTPTLATRPQRSISTPTSTRQTSQLLTDAQDFDSPQVLRLQRKKASTPKQTVQTLLFFVQLRQLSLGRICLFASPVSWSKQPVPCILLLFEVQVPVTVVPFQTR